MVCWYAMGSSSDEITGLEGSLESHISRGFFLSHLERCFWELLLAGRRQKIKSQGIVGRFETASDDARFAFNLHTSRDPSSGVLEASC